MRFINYYILFCSCLSLMGQETSSQTCKKLLMDVLPQYSNMSKTVPSSMLKSFVITMITENKAKTNTAMVESKLEISMGHNIFVAKNADFLSISDSTDSYTLVKPTKLIIRSKSQFAKLTDSLALGISERMLSNIDSFECTDYLLAGIKYQKITCNPTKGLKDEAMIERIEYIIDNTKKLMLSSTIYYTIPSSIKSMTLRYGPVSTIERPIEYNTRINKIFLTNKGTLHDKYRGYKFFDNTKK